MCILRTKNPSGGYVEGSREPAQVRANEGLDEGGRSVDERKSSLTGGILGSWQCQDFLTQAEQHEGSEGWRVSWVSGLRNLPKQSAPEQFAETGQGESKI